MNKVRKVIRRAWMFWGQSPNLSWYIWAVLVNAGAISNCRHPQVVGTISAPEWQKERLEILQYLKTLFKFWPEWLHGYTFVQKKIFCIFCPFMEGQGSVSSNSPLKWRVFAMATLKFLWSQELAPHLDLLVKKNYSKSRLICNVLWGGEN